MKATGIVRRVDELGRIVLPIELRRNYAIDIKDSVEIFVDDNGIYLRKYTTNSSEQSLKELKNSVMNNLSINSQAKKNLLNKIKELEALFDGRE